STSERFRRTCDRGKDCGFRGRPPCWHGPLWPGYPPPNTSPDPLTSTVPIRGRVCAVPISGQRRRRLAVLGSKGRELSKFPSASTESKANALFRPSRPPLKLRGLCEQDRSTQRLAGTSTAVAGGAADSVR